MRAHLRPLYKVLPLVLLLLLAVQQAAHAATHLVEIRSLAFNPARTKANVGDTVVWWNDDHPDHHTATSRGFSGTSGVALWNSDELHPGDQYSFVFTTAGTFPYFCQLHPFMEGTVSVRMKARPRSGTTATAFRIAWAADPGIPAGFNADVQILRPGATQWADWQLNRTGTSMSARFVPDAGPGTYRFRTRLQNDSTGGAGGWSPARKIVVE